MPTKEMTERDAKIVQYLNEAYATERRLEIALQAHIAMTRVPTTSSGCASASRRPRPTRGWWRACIKSARRRGRDGVASGPDVAGQGRDWREGRRAARGRRGPGPLHAVRGTGQQERMLKNARTEYQDEAEEIATYRAIEALAKAVGTRETAKLARESARGARMADFLVGIIDQLALDVVQTRSGPRSARPGRAPSPASRRDVATTRAKAPRRPEAKPARPAARAPTASRSRRVRIDRCARGARAEAISSSTRRCWRVHGRAVDEGQARHARSPRAARPAACAARLRPGRRQAGLLRWSCARPGASARLRARRGPARRRRRGGRDRRRTSHTSGAG